MNKTSIYTYNFAIAGAVTKNADDYLGTKGFPPSAEDQIESHFYPKYKEQCPGSNDAIECWDTDSIFIVYIGNNE